MRTLKKRIFGFLLTVLGTTLARAQETPPNDMVAVQEKIDSAFGVIVSKLAPVLFVPIQGIPLIVLILGIGGIIFTVYFGFINLRLFRHAIQCVQGKFDNPDDHGEISHFQALTSALSATVGLGNIAGVAVAITIGGPGAVFWMWLIAFFGMSTKFSSCTLAQVYRRISGTKTEHVLGGPMVYLEEGIKERLTPSLGAGAAVIGKTFAIIFAVFTITGSIGGGNMFQGNQTFKIVSDITGLSHDYAWAGGLVMAILVGVVIIGGIRRIGQVTSKLVPTMCLFYVTVCLIIILSNYTQIPAMFASIFQGAFNPDAAFGGALAVFIQGAKRAAFSNEAGLGSAAIAHSAAKTKEPVREGAVAMLGPFIDTLVVCTMTALTILITASHIDPSTGAPFAEPGGVEITMAAFTSLAPWLRYCLMVAVFIFAYSTMISWSYYGERAAEYLFGPGSKMPYRFFFLFCVIIGPIVSLGNLIDFTDLLILSMAYPNIIGMLILAPKVKFLAQDYVQRLSNGEIQPTVD